MRTGRFAALAVAAAMTLACSDGGPFRQYEYAEDIYLSLDGTATVYVNSSVPALDALHGASLNPSPNARIDRDEVRKLFNTGVTQVTRPISTSRRSNRQFVHVRIDVDDIRRLGEAWPFAWATYEFRRDDSQYVYRQTIGSVANKAVGSVGWTGRELVAFRLHLPSKIEYHNAGAENFKRGNILVWEQLLSDRLKGEPLTLDARMATQSILYSTLWLFAVTAIAVFVAFGLVILWIARRGTARELGHDHAA